MFLPWSWVQRRQCHTQTIKGFTRRDTKNVMYTDIWGTYFKHVCFYKVQKLTYSGAGPKHFEKLHFFFRLDLSPLPLRTGPNNSNFEADPQRFEMLFFWFFLRMMTIFVRTVPLIPHSPVLFY